MAETETPAPVSAEGKATSPSYRMSRWHGWFMVMLGVGVLVCVVMYVYTFIWPMCK